MALGESIPIIPSLFHLTYIENDGAAFGIFAEKTWLLSLVTVIFLIGISFFYHRIKLKTADLKIAMTLIIAGGLGNLVDRLVKGSVTDMFDFQIWPIFNIADIFVTVGVLLFMVYILKAEEDAI